METVGSLILIWILFSSSGAECKEKQLRWSILWNFYDQVWWQWGLLFLYMLNQIFIQVSYPNFSHPYYYASWFPSNWLSSSCWRMDGSSQIRNLLAGVLGLTGGAWLAREKVKKKKLILASPRSVLDLKSRIPTITYFTTNPDRNKLIYENLNLCHNNFQFPTLLTRQQVYYQSTTLPSRHRSLRRAAAATCSVHAVSMHIQ